MTHSQTAIDLIKKFEGFRPHAYIDPAGVWTVGYGHVLKPKDWGIDFISLERADELLMQDIAPIDAAVNRLAPWATQNQFDALVDFAFNLGPNALATMLHHGPNQVPTQILAWVYAGHQVSQGLVNRRQAEKALFEEAA